MDELSSLFVVPNRDFRDEEYSIPEAILRENGIGIKVAASGPDDCKGIAGTIVSVNYTFDKVNTDEFGAIVFVGGTGVERYFTDDGALGLAKEFFSSGKLVCAICWASVLLAKAGILSGKKVTGWEGGKADLEAAGAQYTGETVTIDGNIITGNGPDGAGEFANKIVNAMLEG